MRCPERRREFAVTIEDQVLHSVKESARRDQFMCDALHPLLVGIGSEAGDEHLSTGDVNEEQNVEDRVPPASRLPW